MTTKLQETFGSLRMVNKRTNYFLTAKKSISIKTLSALSRHWRLTKLLIKLKLGSLELPSGYRNVDATCRNLTIYRHISLHST